MIATGQDTPKHLVCPFTARVIDILPCGPFFYAESKHGWRGPLKKTEKAVITWLKKIDWSKERPKISKAKDSWIVIGPSGWFSHPFDDIDGAQRWLNFKDGENLNPKVEVKHGPLLDLGDATGKIGKMPESSMNIPSNIAHLFKNGVPDMPEDEPWQ